MKRPITEIAVGPDRRRQEMGDIPGLAGSLARYGLIHPVVIDDAGNLIAGGRRLAAAQMLGWQEIDVRPFGELTEAERREIELEENLRRLDLTPYERSRELKALADTAREIAGTTPDPGPDPSPEQTARYCPFCAEVWPDGAPACPACGQVALPDEPETCAESAQVSRPQRGPSRRAGSYRDVSARTGIPEATIRAAERHVDAVEKYPELADLPQTPAIAAAKALDKMPEPTRLDARERIREQARTDAVKSTQLLEAAGVTDTPEARREKLQTAYAKGVAATWDKLLTLDAEAVAGALDADEIKRARIFIQDCRAWLDQFDAALSSGIRLVQGEQQ